MKKGIFLTVVALVGLLLVGSTNAFAQGATTGEEPAWVNLALYITYALIGLALVAAIVLPLIQSAGDPKSLIKTAIGVVAIAVVFFIGYAIADNEVLPVYTQYGVDATLSKLVGGALITVYLLGIIAILSILYTEITGILK